MTARRGARPLLHGERHQKTLCLNVGVIHLERARLEEALGRGALRARAVRAEQQHPHRVSPVVRRDCGAHPGAPSLSSTAGDTAVKKALDPIVPDEEDSGVQELTGIIGVTDSEIDPRPDADVGGRSRLDGNTVDGALAFLEERSSLRFEQSCFRRTRFRPERTVVGTADAVRVMPTPTGWRRAAKRVLRTPGFGCNRASSSANTGGWPILSTSRSV